MAGSPTYKVRVNSKKLKEELKRRNVTLADVAREMGKSSGYLANKLTKDVGSINVTDSKLLELLYNIKLEDYEYKKEEDLEFKKEFGRMSAVNEFDFEKLEKCIKQSTKLDYGILEKLIEDTIKPMIIDYERLYKVIYSATYEGTKKAFTE